jgi:hypothetical protein
MDANDVERRVTAKVAWRFVPFLGLCYFVAYLTGSTSASPS